MDDLTDLIERLNESRAHCGMCGKQAVVKNSRDQYICEACLHETVPTPTYCMMWGAADAIEALQAKLHDMHRRAQTAEAALREPIEAAAPERRTLGRVMANAAFYAEHDRAEALQAQLAEARDKALEDAARKADPPQVRTTKGLWVLRREKIAAAIRAMKGERG